MPSHDDPLVVAGKPGSAPDDLRGEVAALAPMPRTGRLERLRSALDDRCDTFVVTKPENIRWLTGFTGSNGLVAVTQRDVVLVTDERYSVQAVEQLAASTLEAEVRIGRALFNLVGDKMSDGVTALEGHHVTWDQQRQVEELIGSGRLVSLGPVIDQLRRHKEPGELTRLELACRIADRALALALAEFSAGRYQTERRLASGIERAMEDLGADGISFPTIVAAGPNSAMPHARPSDRRLSEGDLLVVDMGAKVDGYGSDMTRSFAIGGFSDETERMYRAVEQSQAAGVAAVAAGTSTREIHAVTSAVLDDHGLGEYFIHGTGHGIGLEIHENPFLSRTTDDTLRSGYVVTVEPGVYIPGLGGVRIEDSVLVTDNGCRRLTNHPKNPILSIQN